MSLALALPILVRLDLLTDMIAVIVSLNLTKIVATVVLIMMRCLSRLTMAAIADPKSMLMTGAFTHV